MNVDALKEIVGEGGWSCSPDELEPHLTEWRDRWRGRTAILLRPRSTQQVADIVKACLAKKISIVPQGGNTGLCGGAIPDDSGQQVLLSLAKMNTIRDVSTTNFSMTVEAGCTLAAVQAAAADVDCQFPLSLAAEGSCQIGGNLSTNAGGINVLRFGTARQQTLGLEVVLPDGNVLHGLKSLRKDTAGYDLKQLFIGAEGTLGVITAATLKMFPAPRDVRTVLMSVRSPDDAVNLLAEMRRAFSDQVQAFELIPARAVNFVLKHISSCRFPLQEPGEWHVLADVAGVREPDAFEELLAGFLESGQANDAVIAKNAAEADELWRLRHGVSEAQKKEGASLKHDVSVPVASVGEFIASATKAVEEEVAGIRVVAFGHVGDGNIHFNLSVPERGDPQKFLAMRKRLAKCVHDIVHELGGSFSAEHGIGQAKREELERYTDPVAVALMRTLKTAIDPFNIMNPGKVI